MDYSPAIPIKFVSGEGNYEMVTDIVKEIIQNFKNIILSSNGDKVCDYKFGVGLMDVLFEQSGSDIIERKIQAIYDQVEQYLPVVEIRNIEVNEDYRESGSAWVMKIYFFIPEFGVESFLYV